MQQLTVIISVRVEPCSAPQFVALEGREPLLGPFEKLSERWEPLLGPFEKLSERWEPPLGLFEKLSETWDLLLTLTPSLLVPKVYPSSSAIASWHASTVEKWINLEKWI